MENKLNIEDLRKLLKEEKADAEKVNCKYVYGLNFSIKQIDLIIKALTTEMCIAEIVKINGYKSKENNTKNVTKGDTGNTTANPPKPRI